MDPDHDADMLSAHFAQSLHHGVDRHSIPDNSVKYENPSAGDTVFPHNNIASESRVQDIPMLPPSTSEETDSEKASASKNTASFNDNTSFSSSNTSADILPAAELSSTTANDFPLGVPMAEDKIIPSRRDYEAAFVLIGHPKTAKKLKNYRITTSPKKSTTTLVENNTTQRSPPSSKNVPIPTPPPSPLLQFRDHSSLISPPSTPPLSPHPELGDASPPSTPNLPPTDNISPEHDIASIMAGIRKLQVSDPDPKFTLLRSLSPSTSVSEDDDYDSRSDFSSDSSTDSLSFNSEESLIQISDAKPIHSTPFRNAVATFLRTDSELWEELASINISFSLPKWHRATTTTAFELRKFQDPIWTMKGAAQSSSGCELEVPEVESFLSADTKQSPQSLPNPYFSPLSLSRGIAPATSSSCILLGKSFELPSVHQPPSSSSPSWIKDRRTQYSQNTFSKHQPSSPVRRPRFSDPLSSYIEYVPSNGFRIVSSLPKSLRPMAPLPRSRRKGNSVEISRTGSSDAMPPAVTREPVVVQEVKDVEDDQVKEVNAGSESPSSKEVVVPEILPVVEEPGADSDAVGLKEEVKPVAGRDNSPGFFARILGMFWGYP